MRKKQKKAKKKKKEIAGGTILLTFGTCVLFLSPPFLGASFPAFFHQTVVNIEDLLSSGWPDAPWLSQSYSSIHFAWHGYLITRCPPVFVTPASLALLLFVAFVVVVSALHVSC